VTALVFAGGGSLGAVQVGMLKALVEHGIKADMAVGSSVGSINAAYFACRPDLAGVEALERLWRSISRSDIFPITFATLARFLLRHDYFVDVEALMKLVRTNLPYHLIEQAPLRLHIVTTDILSGKPVVFSMGDAIKPIVASCAIPAAFAPVRIDGRYLADGGIANNTPVRIAVELGATRLIVLPTGYACSLAEPPKNAIASALHGLTLLIASQLVADLKALDPQIEYHVVPALCPAAVSPFDFTQTGPLIERATQQTCEWLNAGGLNRQDIPIMLEPHVHSARNS
jgi:NTE family protein